eukprot:jgi/Pico_ML_1/55475/g1152.t1
MASSGAPETGTTVVAVRYADAKSGRSGVVLGADSRVSTGTYVSNRASNKIAELAESTYLLRSGSAADTQAVGDAVKDAAERLAMELNEAPSVHALAQITARVAYANKDRLLAAMIVAGWDRHRGGQVYGVPIGGTVVDLPWSVDGSGSTYIYGHCDAAYRDGMDKEEAVAFVQEALALAMSRDGSSGGMVRVVIVDPTGSEKRMVRGDQVPVYHEEIGSEGDSCRDTSDGATTKMARSCLLECVHFESCDGCTHEKHLEAPPVMQRAGRFFEEAAGKGMVQAWKLDTPKTHAWRCRARLVASRDEDGEVELGLYKKGTHQVVDIPECRAHHPRLNEAAALLRRLVKALRVTVHDEDRKVGKLRNCAVDMVEVNSHVRDPFNQTKARLLPEVRDRLHMNIVSADDMPERFLINAEVVVLDPPRRGLDPALMRALNSEKSKKVQKIIYLSCGYDALEKDVLQLQEEGKWALAHAEAFNFFPGTDSIETLVVLQRSSAERVWICMKYAFPWLHLGQMASVLSTFFQASSPPSTSSTVFCFNLAVETMGSMIS